MPKRRVACRTGRAGWALRISLIVLSCVLASGLAADACTSFCLEPEDGLLFASNLEFGPSPVEGLIYVNARGLLKQGGLPGLSGDRAEWVSRYGSLTFNFYGWQHPWAGVNEAGLVASTMEHADGPSVPPFDERPQFDSGAWIQYMLDTCATVEDVAAMTESVRMGRTVDHYLIADREGTVAVVEFIDRRMYLHRGEDLPYPILTNRSYRDTLSYIESRSYLQKNVCGDSLLDLRSSHGRFLVAADRIQGYPEQTETESAIYYALNSLALIGQSMARWSLVFDIHQDRVYFRTGVNPQIRWIDLARLDYACDRDGATPDIHADLYGDVTESFQPFSTKQTTDHFIWFRSFYGASPPQVFRDLMAGTFPGYPCAEEVSSDD